MRKSYRFLSGADTADFCQRVSDALAFALLNNLQLIDISNNLGDSKSLACHPYTTTHSSMSPQDRASLGISPGHIRLSVGLEDCDDLIDDLDQALAKLPG
jgi:cystathionine beta-lyase/cystathionine gamma-synthase